MSRPIVLLEDHDSAYAVSDFTAFYEAGLAVRLCRGPDIAGERPCPLLRGEPCSLAASADVVVFGLGEIRRPLLEELAAALPSTPILVKVDRARSGGPELPAGCMPLPWPMSVSGQVDAVRRAATER